MQPRTQGCGEHCAFPGAEQFSSHAKPWFSPAFRSVRVDYNGVGIDGTKAVADSLRRNRTLEVLNLGYFPAGFVAVESNNIGPEGVKFLASSLRRNHALTTLYLCNYGGVS